MCRWRIRLGGKLWTQLHRILRGIGGELVRRMVRANSKRTSVVALLLIFHKQTRLNTPFFFFFFFPGPVGPAKSCQLQLLSYNKRHYCGMKVLRTAGRKHTHRLGICRPLRQIANSRSNNPPVAARTEYRFIEMRSQKTGNNYHGAKPSFGPERISPVLFRRGLRLPLTAILPRIASTPWTVPLPAIAGGKNSICERCEAHRFLCTRSTGNWPTAAGTPRYDFGPRT